jgi:aminoglycoside phosphotransferase (APT) family kinase protein
VTVHVPAGIDLDGLASWFADNVPQFQPPFTAQQITGGRSNITVRLIDADGRDCIIRRPPLHSVLATAHDVGREYRIIHALGPTAVPTPEAYGNCTDESVIGAPFYAMEFVDGLVLNDVGTAVHSLDEAARHNASNSVVDAHVALHAVDVDAVGLGDLARKDDYIGRQLRRWHRQYEQTQTSELPGIERVYTFLSERIPEQRESTLVHGDLRLGNCIIDTHGTVLAVLDWELCTLGDPLADVGYLLATSPEADDDLVADRYSPTVAPGFATRDELSDRYGRASGRDLSQIEYYVAFSHWKLACILQGVMVRAQAGAQGEAAADVGPLRRRIELCVELAERHAARLDSDG